MAAGLAACLAPLGDYRSFQLEVGPVEEFRAGETGDRGQVSFQWKWGGVIAFFFNRQRAAVLPARG